MICRTCHKEIKEDKQINGDCYACVEMWTKRDEKSWDRFCNKWRDEREYYNSI